MAISAIAGLATAVGAALAPGALTLFGLGAAGSFAAAFAIGAGLSAVSRALMPKPSFDQMRGLNFNVRDPQSPKKMIYGRSRIGGTIIAIGSSGTDNTYLTMVIAIAGHRLQEFEEIYFNDEKIWDSGYQGDWGNYVQHEFIYGYDTDQSSALADNGIAGWISSGASKRHTLNGVAALVVRLRYDAEVFTSGVPNISVVVKGTRAYDPRQDSTSSYYDSSVGDTYHRPTGIWTNEGYTTNPAIILLDYLTNEKYGLGESIGNIDLQSVVDAADICDEDVALDAGGTQKRFTCDGVLDTANTHKANIENILSAMIGTLTLVGGKYVMTAHAYQSPSLDINEDNLIAPLEVSTKQSRRNIYNAVKGSFVSEEENYVVADYPSQVSSAYATADGETIYLDMALPMTTNNIRAQRIARLTMLKSRLQTTVKMRLNLTGLKVKVGDNIRLSNTRLGYTNKIFEIINYNLVLDQEAGLAVEIEAIENDSAAYTWNTSDELDFTVGGTVTLYDGKTAQPAQAPLVLTPDTTVNDDGTVVGTIGASWTAPDDAFTDRYEITWQNTTDSGQVYKQTTLGTPFVITGVLPNKTYQVIVYAINELGVKSTGLSGTATTPADFAPKVPSIYRITKANANAPTTAEFSTAAGRDPKDKDAVITKDTSTTPDSTHAWTYNASTSSWDADDDFVTGDLIIDGTIATANIADAAITNAKIDSLSADKITAGTIDASSITVTNINADNITAGDLSADRLQIDGVTLDTDGGGNLIINNGGVGTAQISSGAITTAKIIDNAITNALIATDAVNQDSIAANSITAVEIVSGTITASEIAASTITGAQIAADTIAVSKLTGDVSEVYPIMIYENQTLTTTAHNSPVFTLHAPDLISKKPKVSLRFDYTVANGTGTNRVQLISANIQIKSKGGSAVQIGTTGGVTVSQSGSLASTIYLSGDHTGSMDYVGAVADSSSPSTTATITGLYYDDANDRTYISMSHSSQVLQTGETLYYHPFRWLSAGVWYSMVDKEQISIYSPSYTTVKAHEYINLMFTSTNTKTDFRLSVVAPTTYTTVTPKFVRLTGTMELIS